MTDFFPPMEFLSLEDMSDLNGWTTASSKKPRKTTKTTETIKSDFQFEFSRIHHEDAMLLLEDGSVSENFLSVQVPEYTGTGQTVIIREEYKDTLQGVIKKLNKLNRVLKNPEHHQAYCDVIKSFIDKMSVDYTTKQIFMLEWVTGTGKTVNGTLLSLLHAINMDKQLIIIVPNTRLSKEMSVATEIENMLDGVINKELILNTTSSNTYKDKFYRVIISTPRDLKKVMNKITKKCIVFADEIDFYVNDENAIMKTLFDPESSQSVINIREKYAEILRTFNEKRRLINEKNKITQEIAMFDALVEAKRLKQTDPAAAKAIIDVFDQKEIKKLALVCNQDKEYINKIKMSLEKIEQNIEPIKKNILFVLGTIKQFYIPLINPTYNPGEQVKQQFTKLNYVFDEENLSECIRALEKMYRYINCEQVVINGIPELKISEPRREITDLDNFCSFYYNVQPTIMVCASATMKVPYMGYFTPEQVVSNYMTAEKTVFTFNHIVSPIKVSLINFSSYQTVDRITGCTEERDEKYKRWADIFSAKVDFYLKQCRPFLQGRTLIQCKGPSIYNGKLKESQKDFIEVALTKDYLSTGKRFTSDPDYYNDESYDTIINTVDESTALRGLNFRVQGVVMFEVGNHLNIKNLLQAIRVGRMCYDIDEEMNVIIFYRGYKPSEQGSSETAVVESFATILEEQGCSINRIVLDESNVPDRQSSPRTEWSRNLFTETPVEPVSNPQTDLSPIIRANRPVVCACTKYNCTFPHVKHCLGLLEKNGINIPQITRQLENYPCFVPKETRMRVGLNACHYYSTGKIIKVECKNVGSCTKVHYFEESNRLYYYTAETRDKTPIHMFCKNAYTDTFRCTSHHSSCARITVPDVNHVHDCQLPHCEEYSKLHVSYFRTERRDTKKHVWCVPPPSTTQQRTFTPRVATHSVASDERINELFDVLNKIRST